MTSVGVLSVTRRYWQCRCGADGGYAVDAVIGLGSRYSRVVQRHCCRLAADGSFARASDTLWALLDVRLAPETVRQVALAHGAAMASFQPTDAAALVVALPSSVTQLVFVSTVDVYGLPLARLPMVESADWSPTTSRYAAE